MKKSKKFVYVFAVVLFFLLQFGFFAHSANAYTSALRINNSTGGTFSVGQSWTLTLTSNLGSVPINICALHPNGARDCTPPQQLPGGPCSSATDATGYWYCSQTFQAASIGQWAEWITAPSLGYDGSASGDLINFSIIGGSISASPTSCTIPVGGNNCPLSFTWSTLGSSGSQSVIYDNILNQLFPNVALSGTQNFNVAHGNGNFTLHNSGIVVATSQSLSATCVSGSTWNGTSCAANGGAVNGSCSGTHYSCFAGTSSNNVNGASSYTWSCLGSGGGSPSFCTENKAGGAADLIVTDFHLTDSAGTAKTTFAPNENIYPSVTVQNAGGTATSSFYISIYSNKTTTATAPPPGSDVNVYAEDIPGVAAGATKTYSITSNDAYFLSNNNGNSPQFDHWTMPSAGGPFTARVFVDPFNNIVESNDANNQATSAYTIGTPTSTPTVTNVTISSPFVRADNVTQYTITETASDSVVASNIVLEYALINYQGENAASPRGYLTFGINDYWPGFQDHHACSGGGWAAVQPSYGNTYIHLDACSVADSGLVRTVTYTVHFDPTFTTPVIDNDISGYTQNIYNNFDGWKNFQTNFDLTSVLVTGATINPKPIITDGTTPYNIVLSATSAAGGADVASQYGIINIQGANAGTYRGYFAWSTRGFPYFGGATGTIACAGGGTGGVTAIAGYGPQYFNLTSCSTAVSGNTRNTTFVISFNPVFTTPATANTLSAWAADAVDGYDQWRPYDTFNVSPPMTGTLTSAAGSCSIANGASSCPINFTWTTTNPVLTSAVTSPYPVANTHVSVPDANNGTNVPFAVPFVSSPRTFYLYNNGVELSPPGGVVVTSSCVAGTGWNGTTCATTVNGACSSPQTHYTCLSGTSANNVNGASYTWDCVGSGGGSTTSCSEVKVAATTITATPPSIVAGNSTTLAWSGGGVCTGTNFVTGGASAGSLLVSPTSTVTYTVTCSGQPASVTVIVKPKPIFIEP